MAGGARTFDEFQRERFFAPLDGVRALSVLMVVAFHMPEKHVWGWLNGYAGVSIFFVLSGFLITTLCLRERERSGRFSLGAFYIRRAFRILPLYILAVLLYGLLAALAVKYTWAAFEDRLPYFLTVSVDLNRGPGPFEPAWSLGIEEKFYVLWPLALAGIAMWPTRWRLAAGAGLLVLLYGAPGTYLSMYLPIAVGCCMAFLLDNRTAYNQVSRLMVRPVAAGLIVAFVAAHLAYGRFPTLVYATIVAGAMTSLLIHRGIVARALSTRPAQWIGRRSYAVYLFHPSAIIGTNHLLNTGAIPRLTLAVGLSLVIADVAHRTIEKPMIVLGRKLAGRGRVRTQPIAAPA